MKKRSASNDVHVALADAMAEQRLRIVASLIRTTGDWQLAEDAVADAGERALARWTDGGIPDNPAAWLTTTARRHAIDVLRRRATERNKLRDLTMQDHAGDEPAATDRADRRRSAPAHLHLLPPCALDGCPGGAHTQGRVEPVDGGDRAGLSHVREHDGATAAAGQAEDRQRRHPVPRPSRRGAPRTPRRCAGRDLPRVHHRLRHGRRRPGRRGDPPRPVARRADARLRRGVAGCSR